ncbi:hypothetical protein LIER_23908 [Lithospermum erythrorhizon]|uniref:Uncharacterized protein n=1 Tax=Lithospermum erythrorhizon TaxID=34254 RepID=A0AAV3R358_LITER
MRVFLAAKERELFFHPWRRVLILSRIKLNSVRDHEQKVSRMEFMASAVSKLALPKEDNIIREEETGLEGVYDAIEVWSNSINKDFCEAFIDGLTKSNSILGMRQRKVLLKSLIELGFFMASKSVCVTCDRPFDGGPTFMKEDRVEIIGKIVTSGREGDGTSLSLPTTFTLIIKTKHKRCRTI